MKKSLLILFLFLTTIADAQRLKKSERAIVEDLKSTVYFLADDKLEGRRTGTPGEMLAADYLAHRFEAIGLEPKGDQSTYLQAFPVFEGRKILEGTFLKLSDKEIDTASFFPLSFSGDGSAGNMLSPEIHESGEPWLYDISSILAKNKNNPHFDLEGELKKTAQSALSKGATAVVYFVSAGPDAELAFNGRSRQELLSIPVIYIRRNITEQYLRSNDDFLNLAFSVHTGELPRSGRNIIGFINNGADKTVILGAHYDHLGYGEDKNSLWTGKPEIHSGADDNASGTALVIEAAKLLKKSKYKKNNYLFILFSGEELGLFGSKYFTEHPTIPLESVNYMINCDMVGRLHDDTKSITIGGYGTSPYWSNLPQKTKFINVKFDSTGVGPSDHTSFYLKDIPVLFFFTGIHTDYHKPSDKPDKINYVGELRVLEYIMDLIGKANNTGKLVFTKTKEPQRGDNTPSFTVTLGVMPDYTYSGTGLRIDGVISDRAAEKAGMKAGDVITEIGEYPVTDIYKYMDALSKFKKGDQTTVTFQREGASQTVSVQF